MDELGNLIVGLLWIIIGLLSVFQYYDHVVYRISLMSVGFTQILIGMIWLSVSYPFIQWRMFKKRPLLCGAYSCDPIL